MKKRRGGLRLWSVLIGIDVLVAGWWWSEQPVTEYQTQTVEQGNIESVVSAIGTVQPREYVDVGVQVSGQITKLTVEPGDEVEKGALLTEIDPSVLQAQVDAGRAQLAMQQAQLQERKASALLAKQQFDRQQRLIKRGATSEEEVQAASAEFSIAEARVKQLEASIQQIQSELKADEATLGYPRIFAPMSGTVLTVDVKEGQTLNANYQTPALLQIANLSVMRVEVKVSEADIHRIHPGQAVRFSTLGNDQRFWEGSVAQVLPAPPKSTAETEEIKAVMYTVLFDVNNDDGALKPGMTAQADFIIAQANDVPLIPLSAVTQSAQQSQVTVLNEQGQPETRAVTLGKRDRLNAQLLSGLAVGEEFVVKTLQHQQRRQSW